jgi:hypothetical protein
LGDVLLRYVVGTTWRLQVGAGTKGEIVGSVGDGKMLEGQAHHDADRFVTFAAQECINCVDERVAVGGGRNRRAAIRAGTAIIETGGHEGPGGALVEEWFGQHRL